MDETTTPLEAARALASAATGRDPMALPIRDVRQEGETVTFTVRGVRYCAVVEHDEDAD